MKASLSSFCNQSAASEGGVTELERLEKAVFESISTGDLSQVKDAHSLWMKEVGSQKITLYLDPENVDGLTFLQYAAFERKNEIAEFLLNNQILEIYKNTCEALSAAEAVMYPGISI